MMTFIAIYMNGIFQLGYCFYPIIYNNNYITYGRRYISSSDYVVFLSPYIMREIAKDELIAKLACGIYPERVSESILMALHTNAHPEKSVYEHKIFDLIRNPNFI